MEAIVSLLRTLPGILERARMPVAGSLTWVVNCETVSRCHDRRRDSLSGGIQFVSLIPNEIATRR